MSADFPFERAPGEPVVASKYNPGECDSVGCTEREGLLFAGPTFYCLDRTSPEHIHLAVRLTLKVCPKCRGSVDCLNMIYQFALTGIHESFWKAYICQGRYIRFTPRPFCGENADEMPQWRADLI